MKPFIEVKNVWQEYSDQVVLERLNLTVNEGEFCTLVGASGCGNIFEIMADLKKGSYTC